MENKLRMYVDGLFARTLPTKKAVELKEEMLQNLHDKYNDLIGEGKTPEAAYNIAIVGIGDVSNLLSELEADSDLDESAIELFEESRRRSAMFTSIAVMIYVLSALPLIVLAIVDSYNAAAIGLSIMFVMIAAATGLLVFNNMTRPRYVKGSNTMVDEFREWQSHTQNKKSLRRSISSALWALIVALYFVISFWTDAWHLSWIIFVLGGACEAIINIFFTLRNK